MSSTELGGLEDDTPKKLSDSDYPSVYGTPLDEEAIKASISGKPSDTPVTAIVDNKQVSDILQREGHDVGQQDVQPLHLFPSPMDAFQYALYSFGVTDIYIVLMVNMRQKTIYGYHILDLTQNYSLADDLVDRLKNKDYLL